MKTIFGILKPIYWEQKNHAREIRKKRNEIRKKACAAAEIFVKDYDDEAIEFHKDRQNAKIS